MAMSYNTLVAPKGTTGSLLNWIGYTKVDTATVLDESQLLLYQMLRVREMKTEFLFSIGVGGSQAALPQRFLDPIGDLSCSDQGRTFDHLAENALKNLRTYTNSTGALGANAITTLLGSVLIGVNLTGHGLTIGSDFTISGGVDFNGVSVNITGKVVRVDDANNFAIYYPDGAAATASGSGGGASMTYDANALTAGSPSAWSIWDELIQFDHAFDTALTFRMLYYRQPLLLSSTNPTNFLTNRYPNLLRVACLAAAAQYMKDDQEYTKNVQALTGLISAIASFDDLSYRGATFGTDTP